MSPNGSSSLTSHCSLLTSHFSLLIAHLSFLNIANLKVAYLCRHILYLYFEHLNLLLHLQQFVSHVEALFARRVQVLLTLLLKLLGEIEERYSLGRPIRVELARLGTLEIIQ